MGSVGIVGSSGRTVGAASTIEENGERKRRRRKEIRE